MNSKAIIPILCTVAFSSCHVYKSYERPDINVSDSLFRKPVSDTVSIASLHWKELFRDPKLQGLIEKGLENNADLNIAELKVREAEARLLSSKLSFLPSVSVTAQGTISKPEGKASSKSYEMAVPLQWEIDASGKLLSKKRGSQAELLKTEAYRQSVSTNLIATIANSYYTLLMLDRQAEIARNTAESWSESVRVMKGLMRAGNADLTAVRQTEASLYAVEASVLDIERKINEMENSLSTLIGNHAQTIERNPLDVQVFPDSLSTGVPLQLLANRPDVREKEMNLAEAFYATENARSAFYPDITLGGNAGWTNNASGKIDNPGKWLFSAIGSLVQPLFNRGTNMTNLKIAQARQQEALIAFQQSILDAGKDVNDALVQWQTAKKRTELDEKQVSSLRSAVHSSELMMEYGTLNYLSVLTAKQSLLRAEMDVVSDKFDKIQGIISLYHALGGGVVL